MEKLKILNLSHSHCLTQTPDFSNMPNLEKLLLKDCPLLSEISPSIGHLNKIVLINLKDCISLCSLPRSIYKLKSLKTFILSGCLKIDKLEEDLEHMESLTSLLANNTAITRVPFSIVRLKSIGFISLCGYERFSSDVFPTIIWSWMSPTNNLPFPFQISSSVLSSLVSLDEPSNRTHELPFFFNLLQSLWVNCNSGYELDLHSTTILNALYATNSKELESTATTSQEFNPTISMLIQMGINCQSTNILKERLQNVDVNRRGGCLLPEESHPDWFTFFSECSSVTFYVPEVKGRYLKSMMCIVYGSNPDNITSDGFYKNNITSNGIRNVLVKNCTKATIQLYKSDVFDFFEDKCQWQKSLISSIEPGNSVEVIFVFKYDFVVKKAAIYLVYDAQDLNLIACRGDDSECSKEEPTDDFNQNRKKKNRVE